ncbi:hypothetical protein FDP41_005291 [Naegleria fowleri]|uniref:Uncharacterized protein n=1 Tax=Naegleria fowleri TaxID=5763 RepID=A0A6A5BPE3_NAEFO|nr:uncharacterized protein FDP41_005291 [Naegleria fowleri]KAF0975964.1 hypothetical protein FDP41_005291 [Naegleria fowleri]CAG4708071.1 unnamed protein product [Naegleria fowleri]
MNSTASLYSGDSPIDKLTHNLEKNEIQPNKSRDSNSIIKFYWMNGYLLLVEYLLYLENVEGEEELLMNIHKTAAYSSQKDTKKDYTHQNISSEKTLASSFETIEDMLIRVDLKEQRKHVPKIIECFENHCIDFGFELYGYSPQKDINKRVDPMRALFCRNPTKEAFLIFIQERIHSTRPNMTQFSKRIDLDFARELRNKFIEKTFLKATATSSESRAQFPSELKTREKKTEFLLNVCNSFIDERHNEHLESYFQKFFGGYITSRNNVFSNHHDELIDTPPVKHDTSSTTSNTSIQRDILIAKRLVSACFRNIMILYFIQIIFSASSSRIEVELEDEFTPATNNFYHSKEYRTLTRQILLVASLIDIIRQEHTSLYTESETFIHYKNVALRDMIKESLQQEFQHHRSTVQQPLEKMFHQLVHEKLLSSYMYLNGQVKRQMELHGYGSKGVDILTRDVLFWIFKIFNALKVTDKNEKEKIKQEQDKIASEEFVEAFTSTDSWVHSDTFKLDILHKVMSNFDTTEKDKKKTVIDTTSHPLVTTKSLQGVAHLYPFQELEEEFPFDDIISQCSNLIMSVQSKSSHL